MSDKQRIFGTDGVRGVANIHPMTVEVALSLGRAVADQFRNAGMKKTIVVGKDTRLSCYMFETALAAGICSMGVHCWLCGPMPTPGVAHLTASMRAGAGVVISASHNPFHDNGIKIFANDGFKLPDEAEMEIERLMLSTELDDRRPDGKDVGRVRRIQGVEGRYIEFLKNTFPGHLSLDGLRLVVDCANGAAYKIAPVVFEELGATVFPLGVQPNGRNINDGCGALFPKAIQKEVIEKDAHLGIALDGDADRLIMVDERGQVVDGDAIMAVLATRLKREGRLKKDTLVTTVMSNIGLEVCMKDVGARVVRTNVGDRYVVEEMRRGGYNVGGEQSGHLVLLDHLTTGDGVLGALQVLGVMCAEEKPISELATVMTRFPQVLINVTVAEKHPLTELDTVQRLIAEAEARLSGTGRVLVRYSGTERKARVMVEGEDHDLIHTIAENIAEELKRVCV
jgi:phosphoglucosamine mutase